MVLSLITAVRIIQTTLNLIEYSTNCVLYAINAIFTFIPLRFRHLVFSASFEYSPLNIANSLSRRLNSLKPLTSKNYILTNSNKTCFFVFSTYVDEFTILDDSNQTCKRIFSSLRKEFKINETIHQNYF